MYGVGDCDGIMLIGMRSLIDIDIDRSMKWMGGVESVAGAQVGYSRAPIDAC